MAPNPKGAFFSAKIFLYNNKPKEHIMAAAPKQTPTQTPTQAPNPAPTSTQTPNPAPAPTSKEGRKKRSLTAFTMLLVILVVLGIITMIMGAFGAGSTDPATGEFIPVTAATIANIVMAPIYGFQEAIGVCLFVLVLGGFLGIITQTGALDAGIATLVHKLRGNELVLIPILMFVFSIGGTTFGMCEESVPFYLLLAATMVAAGFDSMVGAAVVLLGCGCGVLGSTVNPFAIGVAVDSLTSIGIPVNQALIMGLGVALWLATLAISIIYVMRYAKKVKADKGSTILTLREQQIMMQEWGMTESTQEAKTDDQSPTTKLTTRQKWTLVVFALTFIVMIIGFIPWESLGVTFFIIPDWSSWLTGLPLGQWYFDEASAWFLLMTIIIGVIGGISEKDFVKAFITGAADMISVILVIALARSVTVLMGETGLDVWVLNSAAAFLTGMSAIIFAPLSFVLYSVLSFMIPSTSGMATLSMPIMGGLTAQLNFSVETMIAIFSAGSGLVNLFTPTSAAIMGGLALAKIEYTTWIKFGIKLFVLLAVVCVVILTLAMMFIPMTV